MGANNFTNVLSDKLPQPFQLPTFFILQADMALKYATPAFPPLLYFEGYHQVNIE